MFSISNFDYDCTKKCKLSEHGEKIILALTKRAISSEKLAAFIAKTCRNFAEIKDDLGRSALHIASSVDKYSIVEWLLNNGSLINAKDFESGSNALHRAIYYGCIDCAVLLIRYGVNLDLIDNDTLVPLQYVCKFGDYHDNEQVSNEILVWGTNKNYNLGLGNDQGSDTPQFIDFFRKDHTSIEAMAISSFHSMFLDKKGNLYTVGHGKSGRLGIGSENSLPSPKKIKVPIKNVDEKICQISLSKNHSMLLTNKGSIFVTGSNECQQLGFKPPPENLLSFKEIPFFNQCGIHNLIGIVAKDYHSIAYSDKEIYFWGKNNGQFGLNNSLDYITLPKKLTPDNGKIQCVESSNCAMAISTTGKHIFLFYNYKMKVLKPPLLESIKAISLMADDPQKSKSKESILKLLLLTDTNVIYIWYDDMQQYLRCSLALLRLNQVDKIIYKQNQIILLSKGDAYFGKCLKVPVSHVVDDSSNAWLSCYQNKNDICAEYKIRIELKRIVNIDRAIDIFTDDEFESFAVHQENSRKYFLIPSLMPEKYTFKSLLNDVSDMDNVHDIIFHVDHEIFYAHKFIIYSRSTGLKSIIEKYQDKNIYLNFKNLTGKLFELILKYIYSNYFLTYDDLDDIHHSFGLDFIGERKDVCAICLELFEKFHLKDLQLNIKSLSGQISSKLLDKCRFNRLKRSSLPGLFDVVIKCANNQEILAHKCILVTRLEYFNLMFTHDWVETTTISLTTIPIEYMEPIIDFLYTSDVDGFRKQNYTESFLYNMIVICDQFFINRLRKVCEILVMEKMSIRKCGEMLQFACSYNCAILKRGCLDFICQNLSRVLLQRSLDVCDPEVLNCINNQYRQIFKEVFDFRMITPDADAVEDEILLSFVQDFHVDLDYRMLENDNIDKNKSRLKYKESKATVSKRNYEKEAISILKEINVVDDKLNQMKILTEKNLDLVKKSAEVNEKLLSQSNLWMKVVEKKDTKKKIGAVVASVHVNTILNQEEKQKETFINLNEMVKSVEKLKPENKMKDDEQNTSGRLSFGDFKPLKGGKLSQKERKRLSSESTKAEPKTPTTPTTPTTPIEIPQRPNAWGNISSPAEQQYSLVDIMKSPDSSFSLSPEKSSLNNSSLSKSFDKNNSFKLKSLSTPSGGAISKKSEPSSFLKIVEEEKQQKDYFEKLRSKSLVLTQIEETAISELKQFYNVENCEDEVISIERKSYPTTINFAIWQKN